MERRSYPSILLAPLLVACVLAACDRPPPPRPAPTASETLRALGAVERLIDAGKADEALRAAEALAKAASTDPMALEMLGRARIAASRPAAEVADAYANAAALSPDSPGLHGAAGMMAAQAGRKEQALRLLRRAEQLEPGNPQHALMQARVLVETGDAPSALAAAERARALSPLDTTVLLCVARCRIATGDMDGGAHAAQQAVASLPALHEARAEAATLLLQANRATQARGVVASAAENPNAPTALLESLARCETANGSHRQAAALWQRLAAAASRPWKPCLLAAGCLIDAGDTAGAREWLAQARERGAPPAEISRVEARLPATDLSGSSGPRPPG